MCDNPKCVNPDHLFLGTHQDNIQDALIKGRMTSLFKPNNILSKGLKPKNRFLKTEEELIFIKNKIATRTGSLKELAEELGYNVNFLYNISSGRNYKNLQK
jgi:hypothetical protein